MYTLYFSPGACSLATQVVLNELNQEFNLVNKQSIQDFQAINPVEAVPVLLSEDQTLTEGAAIMLFLLNKHPSHLFPEQPQNQQKAIQNIMFANATMHPAYSKLFFLEQVVTDQHTKHEAMNHAADAINALWQVVETKLDQQSFLGGEQPSAADIMLTVYSRWGAYFPVDIKLGENCERMVNAILQRPSFIKALENEKQAENQSQTID